MPENIADRPSLAVNLSAISHGGGVRVGAALARVAGALAASYEPRVVVHQRALAHMPAAALSDVTLDSAKGGGVRRQLSLLRCLVASRTKNKDVVVGLNSWNLALGRDQVTVHVNLHRFNTSYRERVFDRNFKALARDLLAHLALLKSDKNVFESAFLRDAASGRRGSKAATFSVSSFGVLQDRIVSEEEAVRALATRTPFHLLCVTSSAPHKDNATILRCYQLLQERYPDSPWSLTFVGVESQDLDKSASELDSAAITAVGYVGDNELLPLLDSADLLVSASLLESHPLVAVEAMSRGLTPVACNAAAMPEGIGDGGVLVKPGSADEMATAIGALCLDRSSRPGLVRRGVAKARSQTIEGFSDHVSGLIRESLK